MFAHSENEEGRW